MASNALANARWRAWYHRNIKYLDTPETVDAWNKHQLEKSMRNKGKKKALAI